MTKYVDFTDAYVHLEEHEREDFKEICYFGLDECLDTEKRDWEHCLGCVALRHDS